MGDTMARAKGGGGRRKTSSKNGFTLLVMTNLLILNCMEQSRDTTSAFKDVKSRHPRKWVYYRLSKMSASDNASTNNRFAEAFANDKKKKIIIITDISPYCKKKKKKIANPKPPSNKDNAA
jgi:hypothetical protein